MTLLKLALGSLRERALTSALTVVSIAVSVTLFLGVERVREGARDSFAGTISGVDLIVGARGGSVQLLLYTVFRIGRATNNISWESYQDLTANPAIDWTVPYSLGDSYKGHPVVATNADFYTRYRYRGDGRVTFASGQPPAGIFDVAVGASVADELSLEIGDDLVLAHGVGAVSFQKHEDKPFRIVGILAPTGTPIDHSLYITLWGMEAIHVDWNDGAPPRAGERIAADSLTKADLQPDAITAFLAGTTSPIETLRLQRFINTYPHEPLMAILPGVAMAELWQSIGYLEDALRLVSAFVVIVGLTSMLIAVYNSLNERRREMAILRSLGAGPGMIAGLLVVESFLLTMGGSAVGVLVLQGVLQAFHPLIETEFGLSLPLHTPSLTEIGFLLGVLGFGILLGLVPAWRAYRNTLADGMTIRT